MNIKHKKIKYWYDSAGSSSSTYGSGQYLYVLNRVDQTISVIDTSLATGTGDMSASIVSTITLTSSKSFKSIRYRHINKSVYVFGVNSVDIINADPLSGGFNTKSNTTITLAANNNYGVIYNLNDDLFYAGPFTINPTGLITTALVNNYSQTDLVLQQFGRNYMYRQGNKIIGGERDQYVYSPNLKASLGGLYNGGSASYGEFVYDPFTDRIIGSYGTQITVILPTNYNWRYKIDCIGSLGTGIAVTPSGKVITGCINNNNIIVASITPTGGTYTGFYTKGNLGTKETLTRSLIYSNFADRVIIQASTDAADTTGVDKLHICNPNLALGSMDVGFITVGNMDNNQAGTFAHNQICLNQLAL